MSTYNIPNHEVFDLVESSVQAIDVYLRSGDQTPVQAALGRMQAARDDPSATHPLALNYRAIMKDLLGDYVEAREYLEELKQRTPLTDFEVQAEIASNIGVVRQHQLRRQMVLHEPRDEKLVGESGEQPLQAQMADALSEIFPGENKVWLAYRNALSARFLARNACHAYLRTSRTIASCATS